MTDYTIETYCRPRNKVLDYLAVLQFLLGEEQEQAVYHLIEQEMEDWRACEHRVLALCSEIDRVEHYYHGE